MGGVNPPPDRRVKLTAPSNLESDSESDSDSDEDDSSLLPDNDDIVGVSGSQPLLGDINQFADMVDMANSGQVQAAVDGPGQPPAVQASNFSSKDG